jgi:DNA-binding MarR family transcriptional regulator
MSENQKLENCPGCHHHCPVDSLRCRRGKAYFQAGGEGAFPQETPESAAATPEERLMEQFRGCTAFLQHQVHAKRGQQHILSILHEKEGLTQRELTDIVDVRSASLSELLGKIESDGYIVRGKNERDRRNVDIALTEAGKEAASHMQSSRSAAIKELFGSLSAEEQEQLSALLEKLLTQWKQSRPGILPGSKPGAMPGARPGGFPGATPGFKHAEREVGHGGRGEQGRGFTHERGHEPERGAGHRRGGFGGRGHVEEAPHDPTDGKE